jgi:hypothetical protein
MFNPSIGAMCDIVDSQICNALELEIAEALKQLVA